MIGIGGADPSAHAEGSASGGSPQHQRDRVLLAMCYASGSIFWFNRKRFSGSHVRLIAASRG
jgi:hypothetical protein